MTVPGLPIADTPADLTVGWLDAALRAGGHLTDGAVVAATPQPLGTGQMSDAFRVELAYDPPGAGPPTVIAKLAAADATSRGTALALRAYEREVRFYQELAPTLDVRAPGCVYADIEPETARFVLLLADAHPATQGDQLLGCDPDVAASAVAQLVPLHAPRWGDPTLADLEWLVGDVAATKDMGRAMLPLLWAGFCERYAADLDPIVERAGALLFSNLERYVEPGDVPLALVHGDYRLDNLLIDAERAEVVGIVDWQTCNRSPAMRDVAYVIGAGLLPGARREHEAELVRGYHDALVAAGVADYPWAACWDDYRLGTWSGLVMAVGASMMVERTARGDEMFLAMASRHATHALDLDADELLDAG
jgi:hypothetical protein